VAVKLRLMRMGKKKQPTYRLVAADARSPRNGRFIEILGFYDPRAEPSTIRVDNDKAVHWLREGAQPTERVEKLLKISGAWSEFTGEAPPPTVTRAGAAEAEEASVEEAPAEAGDDSGEAGDDSGEAGDDSGEASDDSGEASDDSGEASDDSGEASDDEESA
jgi:small subunit ribosomal protein S16